MCSSDESVFIFDSSYAALCASFFAIGKEYIEDGGQ
jgi:hypothetical protein